MKHFPEKHFHDCILEGIDFSQWHEYVALRLECPPPRNTVGTVYKHVLFQRVLSFCFEAAGIGEFGNGRPMVSIVQLADSAERQRWVNRIHNHANPSPAYPHGIKSPSFTDVYHFVIDSVSFDGCAYLPAGSGFQIICRDFQILE